MPLVAQELRERLKRAPSSGWPRRGAS